MQKAIGMNNVATSIALEAIYRLNSYCASELQRRGLRSVFSDHEWIKGHVGATEWMEYMIYEDQLRHETIYSKRPADIIFSNQDEHAYVSNWLEEKVRQRRETFGDAWSLFQTAENRHLVELTEATRLLSRIQEGMTSKDIELREDLKSVHDRNRALDEDHLHGRSIRIRNLLSARSFEKMSLWRALLCSVDELVSSGAVLENACNVGMLRLRVNSEVTIDLIPEARIASDGSSSGSFFLKVFVRDGLDEMGKERIRDDCMIHFSRALPAQFTAFSRFSSRDDVSFCLAAWSETIDVLICPESNATPLKLAM